MPDTVKKTHLPTGSSVYISPYDPLFDEKVEAGALVIVEKYLAWGRYDDPLTMDAAREVARQVLLVAQRVEADHA